MLFSSPALYDFEYFDVFWDVPRLMMFYLIPKEYLCKSTLLDFPRNPHEVLRSKKWLKIMRGDYFELVLIDMWAWLMWRHFGVKASMESFSGYDPLWIMAHCYPIWQTTLLACSKLIHVPLSLNYEGEIEFLTLQDANTVAGFIMLHYFRNTNFREIIETVQDMRQFEDYDYRHSRAKIDHYRSYYHTRSKSPSVEYNDMNDPGVNPWDDVDVQYVIRDFEKQLSSKDRKIFRLQLQHYTQKEMAEMLGYANHSAVCKRLKKIVGLFRVYMLKEELF